MKKIFNWQVKLGIVLVLLSAAVYYVHFLIFRDARHIFIYLIGDIAFVFLEVLLVTLVLHNLLAYREKQALLKKMNMVIGAFFSEVGKELIKRAIVFDAQYDKLGGKLIVQSSWSAKQFSKMEEEILKRDYQIDCRKGDLVALKSFLVLKRGFLLGLLENQNLLEHESFTDLLWAVFHLTEELEGRQNLLDLGIKDLEHLSGDLKRAYSLLVRQWLFYMKHLKSDYPYLFSLALRTNPFDAHADIRVRE